MKIKIRKAGPLPVGGAVKLPVTVHLSFNTIEVHPYFKPYVSLTSEELSALRRHPLVEKVSLYQGYITCIGHDGRILPTDHTVVYDSRYPKGNVTYREMEDARNRYTGPRPDLQLPPVASKLEMSNPDSEEPTNRVRVLGGGKLKIAVKNGMSKPHLRNSR